MSWSEVGAVAGEHLDPLPAGIVDGFGYQVRRVVLSPSGHRHVRRSGAGGIAEGDVGSINGVALCSVDGGGIGEIDEPVRVLRRDLTIASAAVEDQAAVVALAGDGPGLPIGDAEGRVVSAGGDAVPEPDPFTSRGHHRIR